MKPIKLWTAFTFKGYDPTDLHITHKFLGSLGLAQIGNVELLIADYFSQPRVFPFPRFDHVEMFGANRDIRVLTPKRFDPADFFPELRAALDAFRPDDFPEFRPHVTHPTFEVIELRTASYVLMADKNKVGEWASETKRS